jgi:uncharacterized protein (DUF2252 family)
VVVSAPGERGKEARKTVKRSSQREWAPPSDRQAPRDVLAAQDASRVPELVPIRYGRMLASPFSFFRGAAAIMAADLGRTPSSGLIAQLCGDAHLSNFGVFAAPDRRLVFDLNDFDESHPGPFEWDVKRLAASFAVAGRERGLSAAERRRATLESVRMYRGAMRQFAGMRDIEVWYARFEVETVFEQWRAHATKSRRKALEKAIAKARHKDSVRALTRLCHRVDGELRIMSDPPLLVPVSELTGEFDQSYIEAALKRLLAEYRSTLTGNHRVLAARYRYVDAGRKVVGVGSVGNEAWVVLLLGRDGDDPLFLQAKEAQRSVLEPYAARSRFAHQGRRVVEGQRLMQASSDVFLGWVTGAAREDRPREFYIRQLWDGKLSANPELMGLEDLESYARLCGWTLARAHARSGDGLAIAAYLGAGPSFDDAIADFAEAYADQNQRDYDALRADVKAGTLAVEEGV